MEGGGGSVECYYLGMSIMAFKRVNTKRFASYSRYFNKEGTLCDSSHEQKDARFALKMARGDIGPFTFLVSAPACSWRTAEPIKKKVGGEVLSISPFLLFLLVCF